jgi:Mg2+-importing ATPase
VSNLPLKSDDIPLLGFKVNGGKVMGVMGASEKKNMDNTSSWSQSTSLDEIQALPIEGVFTKLGASPSGLTSEEARSRLETYGFNELAKKKKRSGAIEILYHLRNPLVFILLFAGLIEGFLIQDAASATIIFSIVLMSVVLDVYQESKAERSAELLKKRVVTTATVLRDGVKTEVRLFEVVPGDVFYLSAGDIAPADSRVINLKDLYMDQSALTGESFPVEKTAASTAKASSMTEANNCLFLGTSVVSGSATAVAVKTGGSTEYGKIAKRLVGREPETEFERGLRRFGLLITQVALVLVIFVFFINAFLKPVFSGQSTQNVILESLIFAVALAVGLTPELLPMIVSVNLSKGAIKMSKKDVIVKRLASIQNFGNMDVLCTDKTGTLTENAITLVLHVDIDGRDDEKVLLYSFLNSYHETGLKSPLDDAILRYKHIDVRGFDKIDEVPFDFIRRRVSVVVGHEDKRLMISKGAPEEIARVCTQFEVENEISDLTVEKEKKIEENYRKLSSQGFRVLGVSYSVVEEKPMYSVKDERDMIFLGFIAFMDPPKESSKESARLLKESGIELKILTGDNELVTRKVCEQLGFEIKGVVLGSEVAKLQDPALSRIVETANVFARVSPAQKDRVMNALKRNGHVVGFLGDGINDATSMHIADVGISVDNAVDVAKESADIILLHKDLTVLNEGVLEGRKTFGNTMKYILMGISSNFGNMFSAAGASVFLSFLPMLPIQILLNNLLYDISEVTIPTDNVDEEYIQKPKRLDATYIRNFMVFFGPISSIFDFLTFFIMLQLFSAYVPFQPLFQTAWFIESLSTQTLVIFAIRTRKSPFYKSKPSKPLLLTSLAIVGVAIALPYTLLGDWFQFVRPPLTFFAFLLAFIGAYLLLVEVLKMVFYKRYAQRLEHYA